MTLHWDCCMAVLLLPLFTLTLSASILLLAVILRSIEACIYSMLYGARMFTISDEIWRLETKEDPSDIKGCIFCDGEISLNQLSQLFEENVINAKDDSDKRIYWQATCYVAPGFINYYWLEEEDFNITEHVYEGSREVITSKDEVKEILRKGFTLEKPGKSPWEFILLPYSQQGKNSSVILYRISHALGDGSSLAYLLLFQLSQGGDLPKKSQLKFPAYIPRSKLLLWLKILCTIPMFIMDDYFCRKEISTLDNAVVTGEKYVNWSKPLSLKGIKQAKNSLGATVTDVILACCSKTFTDLFQAMNEPCPNNLSVFIPFNMRSHIDEAKGFRNTVTVAVLRLPTYQSDLQACMQATKDRMDAIKHSCLQQVAYIFWKLITPALIKRSMLRYLFARNEKKVSLVISSTPGPQQKISILGNPVESVMYCVPTFKKFVSIGILSYNNALVLSVHCDMASRATADQFIEMFEKNMDGISAMTKYE